MKKAAITCSLLLLGSCLAPRSNGNRYWSEEDAPLVVAYDDNLPQEYVVGLHQAIHQWNMAINRRLLRMESVEPESPLVNGVIRVSQGTIEVVHLNRWGRVRRIGQHTPVFVHNSGRMIRSHIIIDTRYSGGSMARKISVHEIGHALGLRHDEYDPGSVMYPRISGNQFIRTDDVEYVLGYVGQSVPQYREINFATRNIFKREED